MSSRSLFFHLMRLRPFLYPSSISSILKSSPTVRSAKMIGVTPTGCLSMSTVAPGGSLRISTCPALGIAIDDKLNVRLTERLRLSGVVILNVSPGSSADSAGLRGATLTPDGNIIANDIIIAIDGRPVDSVDKLLARIDSYKVGDTIRVTLLRKGQETEVPITLQPGE